MEKHYQNLFQFIYHPDHLGSSNFVTDPEGNEFEHMEYTPYGESWVDEGTNKNVIGYRFTSKELDTETGLYYFGARYLDPLTSRWVSPDPAFEKYLPERPVDDDARERNKKLPGDGGIFNSLNLNLYYYGSNNPIKYVDPDGNEVVQITLPGVGKTYFEKKLVGRLLNFMNRVENELGIKVKFNSVYRTAEYQTHLFEVYYYEENHGGVRSEENIAEMNAHGLWNTNIVADPSEAPHSMASAFDLDVNSIINGNWSGAVDFAQVIQIAKECGFKWQGWGDKVHFGFYDYESLGYTSRADMIEQNSKSYLAGGTSWPSLSELFK